MHWMVELGFFGRVLGDVGHEHATFDIDEFWCLFLSVHYERMWIRGTSSSLVVREMKSSIVRYVGAVSVSL